MRDAVKRSIAAITLGAILGVPGASALAQSPFASPIASASPAPAAIGSLAWSDPVAAPPWWVGRIVALEDGSLIVVGSVSRQRGRFSSAAAWRSVDGTTWQRTMLAGPAKGSSWVALVVDTGAGLVAVGHRGIDRCTDIGGEGDTSCPPIPVAVWRSADGSAWAPVALGDAFRGASVSGLAAGPLGLLAVGVDRLDHAMTWRSVDGTAWEPARMSGPAFDRAVLMDVAATPAGWVMTGSTGGRPGQGCCITEPNGSTGAAWTSADGVTWQPATVDGTGEQVELDQVFVGDAGLAAVGVLDGGRQQRVWTSPDGRAWHLVIDPDGIIGPRPFSTDGHRMIGSVPLDPIGYAWSTDGVTWSALANTGSVATMPSERRGPSPVGAVLAPDGLVVLGEGDATRDAIANVVWHARFGPPVPANPAIPPDSAPPETVLAAYLAALQAGDCATGRLLATETFVVGDGELCGTLTVTSATVDGDAVKDGDRSVLFFVTLVVSGGGTAMPDGAHDWTYLLERLANGAWRLAGGGAPSP